MELLSGLYDAGIKNRRTTLSPDKIIFKEYKRPVQQFARAVCFSGGFVKSYVLYPTL